eukprot:1022486_1
MTIRIPIKKMKMLPTIAKRRYKRVMTRKIHWSSFQMIQTQHHKVYRLVMLQIRVRVTVQMSLLCGDTRTQQNHYRRHLTKKGLYKYLFAKGAFKSGDVFYYSAVLNRLVIADQLPVLRGGFLCEEMGLGKTIECLAVIHCNRRQDEYSTAMRNVLAFKQTALRKKRVEVKQPHEVKKKVYKLVQQMEEYTYYKGKGTLIIAPVSLIGQWEQELDTRSNGNLTYTRYYGARS